jgi:hypothetical protein
MTRAEMIVMLRGRLHEPSGWDRWSEAQAIVALNTGYQLVQQRYARKNRQPAIQIDTCALVAGQKLYPMPIGLIAPMQVYILDAATAEYSPIRVGPFQTLDAMTSGVTQYCVLGRYIQLGPPPSATLAAGLRLLYIPSMVLAADTSVPMIPMPLHLAIVMTAHLVMIGDTAEGSTAIREELKGLYAENFDVFEAMDTSVDAELPFRLADKGY